MVVAVEPLAQAAGFHAHDRIALRIVGARRTAKEIDTQRDFAQRRKSAPDLALDQIAKELLVTQRVAECRALTDSVELGRERLSPDLVPIAHAALPPKPV